MDGILISFAELFIKSNNVRINFKKRLIENIKSALNKQNIEYKITSMHDRLFLECKDVLLIRSIVKFIPGIAYLCPTYFLKTNSLDTIIEFIKDNYKEWIKEDETFAIIARHDNKIKISSKEIETKIGKVIDRKVNLSSPTKKIFVEMRLKGAFIYFEIIKGIGGLPVGCSGRLLSLMSAGIDSPVSSYLMLKRGCSLDYIHFHSVPGTDTKSIVKSKDLCKLLLNYQPHSKLYLVPFYRIQMEIKIKIEPEYRIVLYRRFMLRIAETIAKKQKYKALVTGEALAQVSSQTIDNMCVIQESTNMLVLRPLIGMNKEEIIKIAKDIGSYEISIIPQGDCCTLFTPKHPTTKAVLEKVKELEKKIDVEKLIKETIEKIEVVEFK